MPKDLSSRLSGRSPLGARLALAALILHFAILGTPRLARAIDHDAGIWVVNQVAVPLNDRLAFNVMLQNRWSDEIERYERTLVRPWISYSWPGRGHVAVGYDLHEFEEPDSWEHRAWQRFAVQHPLERVTLLGHLWMEERFFQNSNDVAVRARFSAGAAIDLNDDYSIVARNEIFIDLNGTDRIRNAGLGENQVIATLRRNLPGNLRFEVGYLQQYLDRRGNADVYKHFATVGFTWRTPGVSSWF